MPMAGERGCILKINTHLTQPRAQLGIKTYRISFFPFFLLIPGGVYGGNEL
jgi:hypothetical protein